jgi:hypothetical protein
MEIVEIDVNVISEIITIEPWKDREWPTLEIHHLTFKTNENVIKVSRQSFNLLTRHWFNWNVGLSTFWSFETDSFRFFFLHRWCGRPFLAGFIVKFTFFLEIKNQTFRCLVFFKEWKRFLFLIVWFQSAFSKQIEFFCLFVCLFFFFGGGRLAMHNYNENVNGKKIWKNFNPLSN